MRTYRDRASFEICAFHQSVAFAQLAYLSQVPGHIVQLINLIDSITETFAHCPSVADKVESVMSYTRKVTYIKSSGCTTGVQRTVTVTQQSYSSSGWVQAPQQPTVVRQSVQPTLTPEESVSSKSVGDTSDGRGSSSRQTASPFEAAVLDEHNRLRAKHSALPLTLDPAISQYAQEWANNIASRNVMQHRSKNSYGENLYACFGKTNVTGEEVVRSWYNEIKDYRFGQPNPGNFSQVGHFTQLVWKNSKRLGVGIAKNGNKVYVVCNYDPPGNYSEQYPDNVTRG